MPGRGTNWMLTGLWLPADFSFPMLDAMLERVSSPDDNPFSKSTSGQSYGLTTPDSGAEGANIFASVNDCGRCGRVPFPNAPKAWERWDARATRAICAGLRPLPNRLLTVIAATVPVRPPP